MSAVFELDYAADLSHRLRMYEILARASQRLREDREFSAILSDLALSATAMVDAFGGSIAYAEQGEIKFGDYICDGDLHALDLNDREVCGVAKHVISTARPYLSNDVSADGFILSEKGSVRGFDKVVAAPILNSHAQPLGCILVHNRKDQRDFYAEDVSMLELLAGSAGSRLELLDSESDLERMVEEMNEIKSRYTSLKRKLELV